MNRVHTWVVHGSNLLVGGTGVVYGWMRYFAESEDPYSLLSHPWQGHVQHAHVLTAPLLVFAGGLIWMGHVVLHYRSGVKRGRRTGITLAAALFPMIFSGYALQISVEETWRTIWMWLHLVTGGVWILFALAHPFLRATPTTPPSTRADRPAG